MVDIWSATDETPFCQVAIDARRMRVLNTLWERWKRKQEDQEPLKPCHLWYVKPDAKVYELRPGLAPPHDERPGHLRHKDLDINLGAVVEKIMRMLRDGGKKTAHDVSIEIAKINGITLPAFSKEHVARKESYAKKEQSKLYRPSVAEIARFNKVIV